LTELRFRQVHLDFHTSPLIPDVGRDFDADAFAQTFADASVDSVTVFGKCHHGMSYYPTKVGHPHPSLTFDLMGRQIEALHKRGIRAPIYLTCVWDNQMAELNPDWQQRKRDGEVVGAKPGEAGWKWICLNSPYLDYQEQQTIELLDNYEVDGLFYDIVFQTNELAGREDQGCCCDWCRKSMADLNLNPEDNADQARHSQIIIDRFMSRLSGVIRSRKPEATIFYNGRVRQSMAQELEWFTHTEIEALPTGGWGYAFYPFWVRYARCLRASTPNSQHSTLPTMGMTGRFHRSWADFGGLKSPAALKFECGAMLANGSVCSVGDQLHPRGAPDRAVYEVIGEAFRDVAAKEPWCAGAEPMTEIALLLLEKATTRQNVRNNADEGAGKMLLELHHQFDILDADADISNYKVVVIADRGRPTPELTARLREHVVKGGGLLLSHEALLDPETQQFALAAEMGVSYLRPAEWEPSFFRLRPNFRHGVRDFEWVLMGPGSIVEPGMETDTLADIYASYFNRSPDHFTSHFYSPRTDATGSPAVTWHGNVAYFYGAIFQAYQKEGDSIYRKVVGNMLDLLLPQRLVMTDAPPSAEVTVTRQGDRHIVHVVNYQPNRRGGHVEVIEEVVPMRDIKIGLRIPHAPSATYTAPDRTPLSFDYFEGVATVTVPVIREHGMVVFEA
jgi:hypothetical protein